MCYCGLCSLNNDDTWDLFESLASYQWQCAYASKYFVCPFPPPYDLHAQSPYVNQFWMFDHHFSYPNDVCSYFQSFDHDMNSYLYYDISDEAYVGPNAMIKTMNERHESTLLVK